MRSATSAGIAANQITTDEASQTGIKQEPSSSDGSVRSRMFPPTGEAKVFMTRPDLSVDAVLAPRLSSWVFVWRIFWLTFPCLVWWHRYIAGMSNGCIRVRTEQPDLSELPPAKHNWSHTVCGDVKEVILLNIPTPLGKPVVTVSHVDANLYHDCVTGRSVTGVLHFVNQTPVEWFCKKQATVETATHGSEFVAAKHATEQILGLRTTLRYLGGSIPSMDPPACSETTGPSSPMPLFPTPCSRSDTMPCPTVCLLQPSCLGGYFQV